MKDFIRKIGRAILVLLLFTNHLVAEEHGDKGDCDIQYWDLPSHEDLIPCWFERIQLTGEIFCWQVNCSDWEYVAVRKATENRSKERIKSVSTDFAPGFRVGGQLTFPFQDWSPALFWTHQDSRGSNSTQINGKEGKTVSFSLPPVEDFSKDISVGQVAIVRGRIKWRYDLFDLELGEWLPVGCSFYVRPFVGVRIADIHENLKDKALTAPDLDVAFIRVRIKCEHKGIGPRMGLDLHYPLCDGFGVFGSLAGSLIWGNVENRTKTTRVPSGEGVAKGSVRQNINLLRPMLDLKMGLTWSFKACCCLPVTLGVAWESHCLFNQFRYFPVELPPSRDGFTRAWKTSGNVITQGMTFSAAVDW